MSLVFCGAECGRRLPAEDLIEVDGTLMCEPCQAAGAKAEQRRDSIDDALAAVRSVTRDGAVFLTLTFGRGVPQPLIDVRYMRIGELEAAAELHAAGNIARELRGFAAVIDNLPNWQAPVEDG